MLVITWTREQDDDRRWVRPLHALNTRQKIVNRTGMDLSSLNQFLKDLPDIRTVPGRRGPDVCSDIVRQLKRQEASPNSRLVVVVLESVRETLKVEGIAPSPTAVFAALSSCLEQSQDAGLSSACCTALLMTMARGVPTAVLRLKSAECVRLIMNHIDTATEAALPCLGVLIGAAGPGSWPAVVPAYRCLLSLVVGDDAKLRKKSHMALIDVFQALSGDEALVGVLQAASEALLEVSGQILAGPQRTAEEAARASNKQRSKAEENIRDAVSRALWLMAVLKNVISLLLVPALLGLAIYSFAVWTKETFFMVSIATVNFSDVNKVFFEDFFSVLVMVDVFLLLLSLIHNDSFPKVIRNSGFVISTILIKISFSAEGIVNVALILAGVSFGVAILWAHNLSAPPPTRDDARCPDVGVEKAIS